MMEQGHYIIYNQIMKELVNFAAVANLDAESLNVVWNY